MSDQKKLLGVFTPSLDRGGAERFLHDLLTRCQERHVSVRVVAYSPGPVGEELRAAGAEVRIEPEPAHWDNDRYEEGVRRLAEAGDGCDIFLINTLWAWHGADAARREQIPYVWMIHDHFDLPTASAHLERAPTSAVANRMQEAYLESSSLIFPTEATRQLHVQSGADADNAVVVPLGVQIEQIHAYRRGFDRAAARRRMGFGENDRLLLTIGRLQPSKGQSVLVRAVAALADISAVRVVLLGKPAGTYGAALEELIRRSGCEDRVRLEPETADVHRWYGIADAYVCASDLESLPLTLLEAAAWELPLISTPVGGIPEFIEHRVNGYLVPQADIEALAQALRPVLAGHWEEGANLGRRAGRAVRQRSDSERYEDRILDLLFEVAGEGLGAT